ncbi:MAG TPA: hypothetical protein VOB72_02965 [Candidatus Dormibacteraeota bacterium]|nr:hypothetical protein [Candidatus Dormibacteraeota bacterium]
MPLVALLGCLVMVGCGELTPTSSAVPGSPPAGSSPGAAPVLPTPSATPPTCRLPIASGDAPVDGRAADGVTGHGGFLDLPAATFSGDAASLGSYDRAVSHWLPVFRAWVLPDGSHYAWGDPSAPVIHVVDTTTGTDRPLAVPSVSAVVSFDPEGLYVTTVVPGSGAPPRGLSLLNPATGASRQITADGRWVVVGNGFAFGQDLDTSAAAPPGGGPAAANRVRRLDLRTGAVTTLATYSGASVQVLAVYGSEPVVAVTAGAIYTVFLGTGTTVFTGPTADADPGVPAVVDGATVWFSSQNAAVWRWTGSGRASRVADVPLRGLQVAGACR